MSFNNPRPITPEVVPEKVESVDQDDNKEDNTKTENQSYEYQVKQNTVSNKSSNSKGKSSFSKYQKVFKKKKRYSSCPQKKSTKRAQVDLNHAEKQEGEKDPTAQNQGTTTEDKENAQNLHYPSFNQEENFRFAMAINSHRSDTNKVYNSTKQMNEQETKIL